MCSWPACPFKFFALLSVPELVLEGGGGWTLLESVTNTEGSNIQAGSQFRIVSRGPQAPYHALPELGKGGGQKSVSWALQVG